METLFLQENLVRTIAPCEVIVKTGANRQGFYLHGVEITNKLADVFKTANGSTPTSSRLIITQKITRFQPPIESL